MISLAERPFLLEKQRPVHVQMYRCLCSCKKHARPANNRIYIDAASRNVSDLKDQTILFHLNQVANLALRPGTTSG